MIAYDAAGMGREGSPLRDRVIFVEGAPRSGTTWLVTLLATHPEIAGVEAESHLDVVQAAGCRFGQGYLFGRPVPPEHLEAFLEAHH